MWIVVVCASACEEQEGCESQCYDRDQECTDTCEDPDCEEICDELLRSCLLGCQQSE